MPRGRPRGKKKTSGGNKRGRKPQNQEYFHQLDKYKKEKKEDGDMLWEDIG